jgi:hypothetical protein
VRAVAPLLPGPAPQPRLEQLAAERGELRLTEPERVGLEVEHLLLAELVQPLARPGARLAGLEHACGGVHGATSS